MKINYDNCLQMIKTIYTNTFFDQKRAYLIPDILDLLYVGASPARYLQKRYVDIIIKVCSEIRKNNPPINRFLLGNACVKGFKNREFPKGNTSHKTGSEFDINYPTYSGGPTQYGDPSKILFENIWIKSDPKNMILDETKVDWWATYLLIITLHRICVGKRGVGEWQFLIHEKIYSLICKHLDYQKRSEFNGIVSLDSGKHMNHHLHMHIKLDGGSNV